METKDPSYFHTWVGVDMLKKDLKESINQFKNLKNKAILEYI